MSEAFLFQVPSLLIITSVRSLSMEVSSQSIGKLHPPRNHGLTVYSLMQSELWNNPLAYRGTLSSDVYSLRFSLSNLKRNTRTSLVNISSNESKLTWLRPRTCLAEAEVNRFIKFHFQTFRLLAIFLFHPTYLPLISSHRDHVRPGRWWLRTTRFSPTSAIRTILLLDQDRGG